MIKFYKVREPYGHFSNFAPRPIRLDEKMWWTSEGYYQAKKRAGTLHEEVVRQLKLPSEAAAYGRRKDIPIRADWDDVKDEIMMTALRAKFNQHPDLRLVLLASGDQEIVEHSKNDSYWGDGGDGSGYNMLGKLIMILRSELRERKNMYGCTPCPKCGSEYRWPTQPIHPTDPNSILCDNCGFKEAFQPPWWKDDDS